VAFLGQDARNLFKSKYCSFTLNDMLKIHQLVLGHHVGQSIISIGEDFVMVLIPGVWVKI